MDKIKFEVLEGSIVLASNMDLDIALYLLYGLCKNNAYNAKSLSIRMMNKKEEK